MVQKKNLGVRNNLNNLITRFSWETKSAWELEKPEQFNYEIFMGTKNRLGVRKILNNLVTEFSLKKKTLGS